MDRKIAIKEDNFIAETPIFEILDIPEKIKIEMQKLDENNSIDYESLKYLKITFYGYDDLNHIGEIIVNKSIADDVISIFKILFEAEFPIENMRLMYEYNNDDEESMEDNNTSGFNDRYIAGTKTKSKHALGFAIDINPFYNPYYSSVTKKVTPKGSEKFMDRSLNVKGMIKSEDIVVTTFKKYGFTWGGDWTNSKDYQHFER